MKGSKKYHLPPTQEEQCCLSSRVNSYFKLSYMYFPSIQVVCVQPAQS